MVIYKGENKNRRDKENVEKNCPFLPLPTHSPEVLISDGMENFRDWNYT